MVAFFRNDAPALDTASCRARPAADEGTFEHFALAGSGTELREWLPIAWAESEAGMASTHCRARSATDGM
jgi:hypothetical protein